MSNFMTIPVHRSESDCKQDSFWNWHGQEASCNERERGRARKELERMGVRGGSSSLRYVNHEYKVGVDGLEEGM
jgi:hypothetical protein